jgi:hypothetical protein
VEEKMFEKVTPVFMEIQSPVSPQEANNRVMNFFMQSRAEIKFNSGSVIQASRGSEFKARMVGTLMGGIDIMPRIITVEFFSLPAGTLIRVRVEDNFGFGSRVGIKKQVYDLMVRDAYNVFSVFPERL